MDLAKESLRKLDTELGGHLAGDAVSLLLKTFEARFSAALPQSVDAAEAIALAAAGGASSVSIPASAFLDPASGVLADELRSAREALKEHGLSVSFVDLDFGFDERFGLGSVTHPDGGVRRDAQTLALESIEAAAGLDAEGLRFEPATDAWQTPFQANYGAALQHFLDACGELNGRAKAKDLSFALATVPGASVATNVHKTAFVADRVNRDGGGKNCGLAVDHDAEADSVAVPADAIYFARVAGVPVHEIGLGAGPAAAALDAFTFGEYLYAAVDTGFDGWFRAACPEDAERIVRATTIALELFANALRRALLVYRDKDVLLRAQSVGGPESALDAVKRAMVSGLPIRVPGPLKAPARKRAKPAGAKR